MKYLDQLRADPRVADVSDERGMGDGYWIVLKDGWYSPDMDCQTIHEYTIKALRAVMAGVKAVKS